ncbi:HNH endonuclease signature motif containing protein [Segniliparus rugosus]|uniref:HNH nuclease domain-containing protein n=1 Tax=Segniliparus rugosus (strain ATCC BAA-974 / DSM 45345 / CCUG 50838 / CIP 108380 / JCM 13579 / CDC 945) TaxID=679197 RepID=E5XPR5_SEGRC|nr:HNH endonuclease signature motif containing protein [Segniliparus rugosus]EFV13663.1 hypothetical protein HMPREF9336_01487 [Segniliparus rugosus ATCC BAA-974]
MRDGLLDLDQEDTSSWSNARRLEHLRGLEELVRRAQSAGHAIINQMDEQGVCAGFGGVKLRDLLADRLSISLSDAAERIRAAKDLGATTLITGEVLPPRLREAAQAQSEGLIGVEHVRVLREFDNHVPARVDPEVKEQANRELAGFATRLRPDQFRPLSIRLLSCVDPDGSLEDERDRRRKSYIQLGIQGADKMSVLKGRIDPEARAYLEVVFAKLAAPGVLNPDQQEQTSTTEDENISFAEAEARDGRSLGQRQHDALKFLARRFTDGKTSVEEVQEALQKGVPMVVNATVTLQELHEAAGLAYTAGQTALPVRDLIRMAAKTIPYLTIFDQHREVPLYLGRSKRTASIGQRIALAAAEGGCSFPGCTAPPNYCEVHHVDQWATGGNTDIDKLTLACSAHHRLAGPGPRHWHTAKHRGATHWKPPAFAQYLRRTLHQTDNA